MIKDVTEKIVDGEYSIIRTTSLLDDCVIGYREVIFRGEHILSAVSNNGGARYSIVEIFGKFLESQPFVRSL